MSGQMAQDGLVCNYDPRHDVFYISLGRPVPSYSDDDITKGVLIRRSFIDGKITGATILDYSKRDKRYLEKILPFKVDLSKFNL